MIGTSKFSYDLWGDTVNTASRMESHGIAGCIQVTARTYQRLRDGYRGTDPRHGQGRDGHLLAGRKEPMISRAPAISGTTPSPGYRASSTVGNIAKQGTLSLPGGARLGYWPELMLADGRSRAVLLSGSSGTLRRVAVHPDAGGPIACPTVSRSPAGH